MTAVLQAHNISKQFGGIRALSDVDIEFRAGEIHAVIGPNGSGKSTLLSILSGAQVADTGSIQVGDRSVSAFRSPRAAGAAGIERMPQELALISSMTVAENVVLGHEPARRLVLRAKDVRSTAREALERLGLNIDVDQHVSHLRPSQQRLVMLARTLHRSAQVVIADEPTAGLLPEDAHHVTAALAAAATHGLSVIYVSHHLDEVARIASRVTVLRDGVVIRRYTDRVDRDELLAQMLGDTEGVLPPERPSITAGETPVLTVNGLSAGTLATLDLEVRAHEIVGFAGLLGSGRDDVLPAIVGEIPARGGSVHVRSHRITGPRSAVKGGVGYLCGDRTRSVLPATDIAGHVTLPALKFLSRWLVTQPAQERRTVQRALDRVGVHTEQAQPLTSLSGGNQQRALLARWFVEDTTVLLVDEPAVGVDVAARASLLSELASFAEHGAVLVASSDVEDLTEICHRIVCFRDGRVVDVIERGAGWGTLVTQTIS